MISVIIPTYNRAALLGRAVDSVLAQRPCCGELIVVDDGSTDATPALLESLATRAVEPVVRVLRQANLGVAAARNAGIRAARGQWLAFLDADDWWLPGKLAVQRQALDARPGPRISHTRECWFRGGRPVAQPRRFAPPDGDIFAASLRRCLIGMSTAMIHRRVFVDHGLFDEGLPCCEDYDFWLRAGSRESFLLVPQALTCKDGGRPDQLSARYRQGMDALHIRSLRGLLERGGLADDQYRAAAAELVRKCAIYGRGCIRHGRPDEGRPYLALAAAYGVGLPPAERI